MPSRTLSREEFTALEDRLLAEAPRGLSREELDRWIEPRLEAALGTAEQQPADPTGSALSRFAGGAARVLNPIPIVQGAASAIMHPTQIPSMVGNLYEGMVDQSAQQFQQAQDAPSALERLGHYAAAWTPLIGPAAAHAGESIASGDVAGGLGETAGLLTPTAVGPVGRAAKAKLQQGGVSLMQKAVKPSAALAEDFRTTQAAIAEHLLKNGINATPGGVEKLANLIEGKNAQIGSALTAADQTSARINPGNVAQRAVQTQLRSYESAAPNLADVDTIKATTQRLLDHPLYSQHTTSAQQAAGLPVRVTRPLKPTEAQRMKIETYRKVKNDYGELKGAEKETLKALGRGLKEEIATEVPSISGLNAEESQLLASQEALTKRMGVTGNRDPVGFAGVAKNPAAFIGLLMDRSPAVKSLIARGLYTPAAKAAGVSPKLLRLALASLMQAPEQEEP